MSRKSRTAAPPSAKATKGKALVRLTLKDAMATLERAGTAQARKTYARHGASEPMFGVSFATLAGMVKKIGVDHDLALQLWDTNNFDARNLALKVVDPAQMKPAQLDQWARDMTVRMCAGYVSMVACEGPHGQSTVRRWLGSKDERLREAGWGLVAQLAMRDAHTDETWFAEQLARIEGGIHGAPNAERYAMNGAAIAIGCRSPALKKAALAVAKRVGKVEVDHGDTSCKTPDAITAIEKAWAHAASKGFATPAVQEQARKSPRTRC